MKNFPTIPQSFIQLYIKLYNEGKKMEKCMVEYETKLTSEDGSLSITTDFTQKIPEGFGRQLNKHSFSGEYVPKLNGNEIIISECEEKLTNEAILEIIKEESRKADVRKYTCINDFGYSQFERNIADRVMALKPECEEKLIKVSEVTDFLNSFKNPLTSLSYIQSEWLKQHI